MGQLLALAVLIVLQRFLLERTAVARLGLAHSLRDRRDLRRHRALPASQHAGNRILRPGRGNTRPAARGSLRALMQHPREVATVVGLTMGGTLAFYTYTTYAQKFLANTAGFSKADATLISAVSLLVFMLLQPVVGALSDRTGRRPVLIAFGVLGTVLTIPIMHGIAGAQTPLAGIRLGDVGSGDRHRLHRHQRGGEGRTLPRTHTRTGRGPALCADGFAVRRHRRVPGAVAEEHRP